MHFSVGFSSWFSSRFSSCFFQLNWGPVEHSTHEGSNLEQEPVSTYQVSSGRVESKQSTQRKGKELLPSRDSNPGLSIAGRVGRLVVYRGLGIYVVKGSVHVFFGKLHHRGERGRKGRECKISKQSTQNLWHHNYLDPCTLTSGRILWAPITTW